MREPGSFTAGANTIAVLALLVEFLMLRAGLLRTQIHLYAVQSFVVSALAGLVGWYYGESDLFVLAGLSCALKVIAVPWVLTRLLRNAGVQLAGTGRMPVASATLLALAVAVFGFFMVGRLHLPSRDLPSTALSIAIAMVLVSFVLMIHRFDVVSQAIGFFSLENGVSLASLVVAAGLPLILEVAFLFDLLVAVVVFGILMRVHHRRSRTLSTRDLTTLRG